MATKSTAFNLEEFKAKFEDKIQVSDTLPFIIPLAPKARIDQNGDQLLDPPGFVIPVNKARDASFTVKPVSYKTGNEIQDCYVLNKDVEFVVVSQSQPFVEKAQTVNGNIPTNFQYEGMLFENGQPTHLKNLAFTNRAYRVCTKYLVALIQNNKLISTTPFTIKARGGFGASFYYHKKELFESVATMFQQNLSEIKGLTPFIKFKVDLKPFSLSGNTPFLKISRICLPSTEGSGSETRTDAKNNKYSVELVNPDNVLVSPDSDLGRQISQMVEQYSDYQFFKSSDDSDESPTGLKQVYVGTFNLSETDKDGDFYVVPFNDGEESFVLSFNNPSLLPDSSEAEYSVTVHKSGERLIVDHLDVLSQIPF